MIIASFAHCTYVGCGHDVICIAKVSGNKKPRLLRGKIKFDESEGRPVNAYCSDQSMSIGSDPAMNRFSTLENSVASQAHWQNLAVGDVWPTSQLSGFLKTKNF